MPDAQSWEPHAPASAGGVTSVTASSPLASTGGTTPEISLSGVVPVANGGTGVATAAQNRVLATPDGSTGAPSFRALVAADLPTVTVAKGGTGVATASANAIFGGPTSGGAAAPSFRALVAADLPASSVTPYAARLSNAFEAGGTLLQWQSYPTITSIATYLQFPGSSAVGFYEFPLVYSVAGGTYPVVVIWSGDVDILATIRVRATDGTWSTLRTETLLSAQNRQEFSVVLAAGESYGLHFAPSGGTVNLGYWELFL